MIKLIVCDIDGTLVEKDDDAINPRMFDIIEKFNKKGVLFVPASGRQLYNLESIFAPVSHILSYIPENGSIVKHNNKIILEEKLDLDIVKSISSKILNTDDVEILICSTNTSFTIPKNNEFLDHVQNKVKNHITVINSLDELPDNIVKISIKFKNGVDMGLIPHFLEDIEDSDSKLRHSPSAKSWYDFTRVGVHKGYAIKILQDYLDIDNKETIAFGDSYNDIEMLQNVGISYAMENAPNDIKNIAKYTCSSVFDVLENIYNSMEAK